MKQSSSLLFNVVWLPDVDDKEYSLLKSDRLVKPHHVFMNAFLYMSKWAFYYHFYNFVRIECCFLFSHVIYNHFVIASSICIVVEVVYRVYRYQVKCQPCTLHFLCEHCLGKPNMREIDGSWLHETCKASNSKFLCLCLLFVITSLIFIATLQTPWTEVDITRDRSDMRSAATDSNRY